MKLRERSGEGAVRQGPGAAALFRNGAENPSVDRRARVERRSIGRPIESPRRFRGALERIGSDAMDIMSVRHRDTLMTLLHRRSSKRCSSARKNRSRRASFSRASRARASEDELLPNEFAKATEAEVAAALEKLKIEYIEQQRAFQLSGKSRRLAARERSRICAMGAAAFSRSQSRRVSARPHSKRSPSLPIASRSPAPMSKRFAA